MCKIASKNYLQKAKCCVIVSLNYKVKGGSFMKKLLSVVLAIVMVMSAFANAPIANATENISEWDIYFELNEDGTSYEVTGCYAFATGVLNIPESYNGLPVIGIGSNAFYFAANITDVILPDSVEYIGDSAFSMCQNLESITFGSGLKSIGIQAFVGASALSSVTLPKNLISIGEFAFADCSSLCFVTMGNKIQKIGENAFKNTAFYDDTSNWTKGILYIDNNLIKARSSVKNVCIKDGVKTIADGAFGESTSLSELIIPQSLRYIGDGAFGNSKGLNYTFYMGSKAQFNAISKGKQNNKLSLSSIHYNTDCHTYSEKWTVDIQPTCTEEGEKSHHCTQCESRIDITPVPELEHTSSEWITDKKATVNAKGKKHKECTECGEILKTAAIKQLKCSKPKLSKIENTSSGVKITWGKVNGADSYEVYRKTTGSGSYKKIGKTSKTYYTDKKASSGKKYYYIVKAVNEAGVSSSSSSLSKLYLADPTLKTPSSTKKGITLKWSKVTGAEGYQVYRKTGSGSYSKIATVKGNSKVTYTDKKAKKGKTYTYKITAYKSKVTSAYSNTKAIKDKY